ncbi:hypothetical protein BJX70DRAFT_355073 [Aspergillus crustosus]
MKILTAVLALTPIVATVLAAHDACKETLVYCGSSLIRYNGYTVNELRSVLPAAPLILNDFYAYEEPADALFRCVDAVGGLGLAGFCLEGCVASPNGDACAEED